MKSNISVSVYWRRKVVYPLAILAIAVTILSLLGVKITADAYARKSIQANAKTLAMLVVDPILLSDDVEVMKRVYNVGSRNRYIVRVVDSTGSEIEHYDPGLKSRAFKPITTSRLEHEEPIISNDGRLLGRVKLVHLDVISELGPAVMLIMTCILFLFLFLFYWLLKSVQPIVNDIMGLGTKFSNHQTWDDGSDLYFSESLSAHNRYQIQSNKLIVAMRKEQELSRIQELGELAAQVAHDIRSPLTALGMIERDLSALPEDTRVLLRQSINRIRDIANDLLQHNRANKNKSSNSRALQVEPAVPTLISSLIESITTEKRLLFRQKIGVEIISDIDETSYGLFANIQPIEMSRMISNLVNNSVEAIGDQGEVKIRLSRFNNQICIEVIDNGPGIAPNKLSLLGQRGQTFDKENGSGLGLYHAKSKIESWGGNCLIDSELGKGTVVKLLLPATNAPSWFVPRLCLENINTVVILDDDPSIQSVWDSKLSEIKNIDIIHLTNPEEFKSWVHINSKLPRRILYLCDYELKGHKESGIDLIEELNLANEAILVTSRFDDLKIQSRCEKINLKLIPKGLVTLVPFDNPQNANTKLSTVPGNQNTVILIDDDLLVHAVWQMSAASQNINLICFSSYEAFIAEANNISTSTPIYLDSNLGDGVKGETLIPDLRARGFSSILLTTGYEASQFNALANVKIIGKEPPVFKQA